MAAESIPYGRVDGLGQTVNTALAKMETNLAERTPGAIKMAHRETVLGIRAGLLRRLQDGTVVIVK